MYIVLYKWEETSNKKSVCTVHVPSSDCGAWSMDKVVEEAGDTELFDGSLSKQMLQAFKFNKHIQIYAFSRSTMIWRKNS